ncbi:uncharacterized protein A1O9_07492 [Exophiala aquamarina CBS 119918]|uniref:Aldehyde dehydrogenase domain-containing protein n=1 Tax=Exophiala aquamarina CBS 119918 TaxID=1182545 RepID=A0A072P847_9EURO|nr:uncharacterized protein A1O9_07492 [Exophiala aquamarina CBS 119918]KEF55912.1 hypothetical protein A1O9_07492 [Exophiala aquamarina CBS 119918]
MAGSLDRVLAAAVEGQARSQRFIQRQLNTLHEIFVKDGPDIRTAMKTDSSQTNSEIEIQYTLALESIVNSFSESDFDQALAAEYRLAKSENTPDNRCAYGIVYIEPASYNLVYSCVTAVTTAIAAGNCVVLKLPKTLSTTSEVLRKTLSNGLDRDTFAIVEQTVDQAKLSRKAIRLHASADISISPSQEVLTVPNTRSVAIVDRYADMQTSAKAIIRARFTFEGKSPLAPHLVLVNEFRIKEFCSAVAENTGKYFTSQIEGNGTLDGSLAAKSRAIRASANELDKAGAETILSGSRGVVVRVNDRSSSLLKKHVNEPLLIIHPVTSLDDAMDLANETSNDEPLSALHIFGTPEVAKYVSQFVHCHLTCVNEIPVELIVAPLTPIGFATQLGKPYRKEMFSLAKPQYIHFGKREEQLTVIIESNNEVEASKLRKQAQAIRVQMNQPAGHAIGHFEQGLLVGASIALVTIVSTVTILVRQGIPLAKRWRFR